MSVRMLIIQIIFHSLLISSSYGNCDVFDLQKQALDFGTSDLPGGSLIVQVGDDIPCISVAGFENLDFKRPFSAESSFPIASLTKMFTAKTILGLIKEGKLSIDDSASKYVTDEFFDLAMQIPHFSSATILNLLRHTSRQPEYFADGNPLALYIWRDHPTDRSLYQPEKMLDFAIKNNILMVDTNQEPITHYSNTNYLILGKIIETITGLPLNEAFKKYVYEPYDLKSTFAFNRDQHKGPIPTPYHGTRNLSEIYIGFSGRAGDDGLASNLLDMNQFIRNYVSAHEEDFIRNQYPQSSFSTGIFIRSIEGVDVFFHTGKDPGFLSLAAFVPAHQASLVFFVNQSDSLHGEKALMQVLTGVIQTLKRVYGEPLPCNI